MAKNNSHSKTIYLFNTNFTPLAGVLGLGYFLHPCSISVIRQNENQGNNLRDLSIGYFLVFLTYLVIGVAGYFGFIGSNFSEYMVHADYDNWPIAQNCIVMFKNTDIKAFVLRFVILILTMSTFPIINFFFTSLLIKLWRERCKNEN